MDQSGFNGMSAKGFGRYSLIPSWQIFKRSSLQHVLISIIACLSMSPKHPELAPVAKMMEGQSFTIVTPWL